MNSVVANFSMLLQGAYYTLLITVVSMVFGLALGFLLALGRLKGNWLIKGIVRVYVSIIRGTPVLVQIFIVYYGLPDYGIQFGALTAAYISLSINMAAYLSETIRASILSVPKGQVEAAVALGMSNWQAMRRIVLPQAARIAIPPMGNTFIGMLKETSLVSTITVTELLRSAQLLISQYLVVMPFYIAIALMYWVMSTGFSTILNRLEAKLSEAY